MKKKRILKDPDTEKSWALRGRLSPASKRIKQANLAEEFEGTESKTKHPKNLPAAKVLRLGFFCWRLRCGIGFGLTGGCCPGEPGSSPPKQYLRSQRFR